MSSLGYLVYLAFIFVPGVGLGELLEVWREHDSLTARIAFSFGLGLTVDTTVVMVRTSGVFPSLVGLDLWTIYSTIVFGLAVFLLSSAIRKRVGLWVRPRRLDLVMAAIVLVQGLMILLYFQKYPIFPEYQSPDYAAHVQYAQALISGSSASIPAGLLYYGVHFQLASSLLLVGGNPLVTVRLTMALLAVLSPLLFYLIAQRLFSSSVAAAIAALVYSLSGTIWFGSIFNTGLYANFFGILASLFLIVALIEVGQNLRSRGAWAVLCLAAITAYFSHYSTITLLPAVLLLPLVEYFADRALPKRLILASLLVVAPAAIALLVYPSIVNSLELASNGGGVVTGSTWISGLLSAVPILSYMAVEVTYDVGFLIMLILFLVYLWRTFTMRSPLMFVLPIWFISLLVTSPLSIGAWRFSFEALVPLTLMAAFGLFSLLPRFEFRKGRKASPTLYWKAGLILVLVLVPLFAGSWGVQLVSDATTDTQLISQSQLAVNDSIFWLGTHTPENSTYLSVSDFRFTYTSLFFDRQTTYVYLSQPGQAIPYANQQYIPYIIVTQLVTAAIPNIPQDFPWNNFPSASDSNLTLIYSNSDVRVYQLT
ncbi:MAG: glycosyltransferase family 39 protein [Thaumarchaeota archaeon]|nr:glycosyltransferase family 39 protein [Nitrososphaerota archaeon]